MFNILAGGRPAGEIILWDKHNQPFSSGSAVVDGNTIEVSFGSRDNSSVLSLPE